MANSIYMNANALGPSFSSVFTPGTTLNQFPPFQLGTRMKGDAGTEWVFVKAGSAITGAGYVVTLTGTYQADMLSTSNDAGGSLVGIANAVFATGNYGWVQVLGNVSIEVLASAAANVRLNTTATAGALDDDGTTGAFAILGLVLTAARTSSAGLAAAQLNYPSVAQAAL